MKLNEDGTVHLLAGMSEIGSGSNTAMVQVAAEVLGVEADAVALVSGDTETTPFDMLTAASRVTVSVGNAVQRAAADAREQLLQLAADRLEANPVDLACRGGRIFVEGSPDRGFTLGELVRYAQTRGSGPVLGRGSFSSRVPQSLHPFGTQIVEVEVDEETGEVTLTRIVAAHDVGCAINPQNVEGQIQGGVTQAIGHTLMEEVKYSPQGEPLTAGFLDYKIPSSLDLPAIEPVIVEVPDEEGPFGARGIGEPPILAMAPAIANAIYDAVGVRITSLPITAEKVRQALREKPAAGGWLGDIATMPPPTHRGRPRLGAGRPALDSPHRGVQRGGLHEEPGPVRRKKTASGISATGSIVVRVQLVCMSTIAPWALGRRGARDQR